MPFQF
jgi:hypothetical protein